MDLFRALDNSPVPAAMKRQGSHVLVAWRRSNGAIDRYRQRRANLEFARMPVNYPLNGLDGTEFPDAWEPLAALPPGMPPDW
jgi:hypothetical protein